MKTYTSTLSVSGTSVICSILGHKFRSTRKITNHFSEYQCRCCGKQMTEDPRGRLISLTPELRDINETLHMIFRRRQIHI
ncbi:hypothetical protein H9X57_17750 [Flavobacterium piscinae]|jgi:hypothetical protein|uniref:Uncharacterized protein n=1 Tax=Flavobacterium piscinae TaxID=2506424 RepID=A0A4Q1KP23_9FLAO|nr:hypothetical protein [Flavobacterium piscinae]MBC8884548.1 hypothetical protein [Flavobacterium piscinae]RXR31823.1 hypothetical protein EQG68_09115 [Flavobacterium piscinae]